MPCHPRFTDEVKRLPQATGLQRAVARTLSHHLTPQSCLYSVPVLWCAAMCCLPVPGTLWVPSRLPALHVSFPNVLHNPLHCLYHSCSFFPSWAKCHFFRDAFPMSPLLYGPLAKPNPGYRHQAAEAWGPPIIRKGWAYRVSRSGWGSPGPCSFSGSPLPPKASAFPELPSPFGDIVGGTLSFLLELRGGSLQERGCEGGIGKLWIQFQVGPLSSFIKFPSVVLPTRTPFQVQPSLVVWLSRPVLLKLSGEAAALSPLNHPEAVCL